MKHISLTFLALLFCILSKAQAPITGPSTLCDGTTITLADATPGGTWTSSNPSIATVSTTTGIVTGISAGITTITYNVVGTGFVTQSVSVNALPTTITGTASVCPGTTTALGCATGGGTWTSSMPAIATVGLSTGLVTGVSAGVSIITYTIGVTGCFRTLPVTVNGLPSAIGGSTTVCAGGTGTLTSSPSGGTWASSSITIATVGASTGVLTGVSLGVSFITYTLPTGCYTSRPVTVSPASGSTYTVTGGGSFCAGGTGVHVGLSGSDAGIPYTLLAGTTVVTTAYGTGASIDFGLTTTPGTYTVVAYYGCSCATTMTGSVTVVVNPLPTVYTITGGGTLCPGSAGLGIGLSGSDLGVSYQLYAGSSAVGSPVMGTGAAISFGLLTLSGTYTVVATNTSTGCNNVMSGSAIITMGSLPTISASATTTCGGITTLTGSGGVSYVWAPSTGLSCSTCSTTTMSPGSTTVFTLTGTDSYGCVNTGTVTVDGNRISGYITYTGSSSDTFRVWLVHYNPSDSSIIATDSTYSCMVSGTPYYEFMDEPSGSYMVKARLLGTVPGTSGYIPTYSLSTSTWSTAASVSHTTGFDTMHINMIYGTVPAGPGFISGFVYAGAGKGTTGDYPEPGMLVYLKDGSGNVLTYTYTDATGAYSFTGLGYGTYVIYPTEFDYYTTPSSLMTLSASVPSVTGTYFKKHTSYGTITPLTTACCALTTADEFSMYPNPTTGNLNIEWTMSTTGDVTVSIYDMTGREVYTTTQTVTGNQMQVGLNNLKNGVYQVHVAAATFTKNEKLLIQH